MAQNQANEQPQAAAQTEHVDEQDVTAEVNQEAANEVDALDALLDDISSVLETNAEEYVASFVQKGGQ